MECWQDKMNEHEDRMALLDEIESYGYMAFGDREDCSLLFQYINKEPGVELKEVMRQLLPVCKLLNKLFYNHSPFET